jgi:putative transposase
LILAFRCKRATGKKLRVLTVIDAFSRFSPVIDPRYVYRGEDVVRTLEETCKRVGYPKTIRVDQGSEFISRDLDLWAYQNDVTLDFSRPGKPTDNAFIESFNGKFRAECLNAHWFLTLEDAREKMEHWRRDLYESWFVKAYNYSLLRVRILLMFARAFGIDGAFSASTCIRSELYPAPRSRFMGSRMHACKGGTKLQLGESCRHLYAR